MRRLRFILIDGKEVEHDIKDDNYAKKFMEYRHGGECPCACDSCQFNVNWYCVASRGWKAHQVSKVIDITIDEDLL